MDRQLPKSLFFAGLFGNLLLVASCIDPPPNEKTIDPKLLGFSERSEKCQPLHKFDFAFTSRATDEPIIYLYSSAQKTFSPLVEGFEQPHWVTWSPNGKAFAFQSSVNENREVFSANFENAAHANISNNPAQDLLPSWSPNGQQIAYFSSRDRHWKGEGPLGGNIFLSNLDGSRTKKLALADFNSTSAISWSPDGETLGYTRYEESNNGVYFFSLETEKEKLVYEKEGFTVGPPVFSPDGTKIVFSVSSDAKASIYQLSLTDGRVEEMNFEPGFYYPSSWSPDGLAILVTFSSDGENYDIYCLAADGSYSVPVIASSADERIAVWRPRGEGQ